MHMINIPTHVRIIYTGMQHRSIIEKESESFVLRTRIVFFSAVPLRGKLQYDLSKNMTAIEYIFELILNLG